MNRKGKRWKLKRIKIRDRYRLGVYNDTTYEQILYFRLNGRGILITLAVSVFTLICLTTVLIAFTPIREFIPGYPSVETRRTMQQNIQRIDSLENVVAEWYLYIDNYMKVVSGNVPGIAQTSTPEINPSHDAFADVRSNEDSLFRAQIEQNELFNLNMSLRAKSSELLDMYFIAPLKGTITSKFNVAENHFGVDVVSVPNDVVLATLDGTIIMAEWTMETGNVIQIQHSNNLISTYKHNAKLIKKHGSKVKAGDAIAIVGNSGAYTSGHHLHFELWYKGTPIDPEQYIVF
ncbi:MAG: M23 family metallopeptidase [Prevotellaceae bacterium]|jgi:murein DD-endopeptidase MepM/ murein hydrolase activator NlpD|nr:M23 family metallopeptidase [Prevotellaceae bacterium]